MSKVAQFSPPSLSTGGLSLKRNVSWALLGNLVYAACQWGILVVLAWLGTPEGVGQFALAVAITAPVIMLTNLQLRVVIATDARQGYEFSDYRRLRLMSSLAAFSIISLITALSSYRAETAFIILVIGLAKAIEALSDIHHGFMQFSERMDRIALSLLIRGPLSLLVAAAAMYLTGSVLVACVGLCFVWLITLLSFDMRQVVLLQELIPQREQSRVASEQVPGDLKRLVMLSLPLGIVMMLFSLNINIPRYILEHSLGEYELGIFAALAYVVVAGNMFVQSIGQSASPRFAKLHVAGDRRNFTKLLLQLSFIGLLVGFSGVVIALFAGEFLLNLMYGPEYAAHQSSFVWIMVAGAISFATSILGYAVTAMRAFREQVFPFLIVAVVTLLASWLLVPSYGIKGAAFALAISNGAAWILLFWVLMSLFRNGERGKLES